MMTNKTLNDLTHTQGIVFIAGGGGAPRGLSKPTVERIIG